MAPHNEEDDPAIYRSGTRSKPPTSTSPDSSAQDHDNNGNGNGNGNGHSAVDSPKSLDEDQEMMDEEEDSTLLTVQPGFNRLLLVLRDERVMRFVKYVSAAAEGSRWDVCGEFEVGMVADDEDDDE